MTDTEKSAYIDADLCLMNSPSKTDFPGAKTRWDDLQYVHINLTNIIHGCVCFCSLLLDSLFNTDGCTGWISSMASCKFLICLHT